MRPNVLVLDEPAAGLDPRGRREMLALVRDYHARGGVTVIMVSHSMDDVARMCSRIIVMNHGKVAFDAPPAQVFAHGDELAAMGLGIPACAQLANRLRERGFEIPSGMFEMEETGRCDRRLPGCGRGGLPCLRTLPWGSISRAIASYTAWIRAPRSG